MSELKLTLKNENILADVLPPMTPELNEELYYNCSECSSLIEIISIDEENNTIEFKCLNKDNNHKNNNIKIPLKEYLERMKKYNKKKINNDECEIHKSKYISYCFNCNSHLCRECLKTRIHLNHNKNNIIEIKPMNEELHIIKEVIIDYEIRIEELSKEKENKIKELNNILNQNKNKEKEKNKANIINIEKRKEKELQLNNDKYAEDINEIIKRYKREINLRKTKYIKDNNNIINKYKTINEEENIIHKFRLNELEKKFNEEIKNLKYNKQIENMSNIKRLNEIVLNTYNIYNDNYFNSININSILQSYMKNDHIKNDVMINILKTKYDKICELILQKNKVNNIQEISKEKEENLIPLQEDLMRKKIINELTQKSIQLINGKIKELNEKWKNKINELKNKFQKEFKEKEILNQKLTEQIIINLSKYSQTIIEQTFINYDNHINGIIQKKLEEKINYLTNKKKEIKDSVNDGINIQKEIKEDLNNMKDQFFNILNNSVKGIENNIDSKE